MISQIALPAWLPDQSNNSGVLLTARNVFPAIDGYRPIGARVTLSDALPEGFQGGSSAIETSASGGAYLFAGTSGGLYDINTVSGSWNTLLSGLSVTGRWYFEQFKGEAVAVNGGTTYLIDLAGGTASALVGAPTATSVAVVGDHVVMGQANSDRTMVRWSAFDDPSGWINGTNQAGEQPMPRGGTVQRVIGGEYGIILQRERIVRMDRTGDSDLPFEFNEISANYGCAAAATVAVAGRTIFFWSDRGFTSLDDGQALNRIGSEKVDRAFADAVSRDELENIYAAVDPQNNLVMWLVPGSPARLWIYNWELDRWSDAEFDAKGLFPGFTTSISLDDFPSIGITNLDTLTVSLDDPRWSGGNPRLYAVGNDDTVGVLEGETLGATLEMGFNQFVPTQRTRMHTVRPVTDATSGMTVTVNGKARLGDTNTLSSTSDLRPTGVMPVRVSGRYIATTLNVAAGTTWNYVQGLEFEFEPGGRR